jgi:anaerobic magnesium-protoporphyrin IX monomethyl ester cyclase
MKNKTRVTLFWTLYTPLIGQRILPSLSLAYLAKILVVHKVPVTCIDSSLMVYDKWNYSSVNNENKKEILDKLIKEVEESKPAILGIGFWTEGVSFVREFVSLIKKRNPQIKIVVGGPSATFLTEKIFTFLPEIDYIVRGEGELTLLELVKRLAGGRSTADILGLSYRRKGKIVNNGNRPLIADLDRLPLVDYEDFVYTGKKEGLSMLTSRGCPFRCSYCSDSNFYGKYRVHSPSYLIAQIRHFIKLYRPRYIALSDDNVVVGSTRAIKLFSSLAEVNLPVQLPIGARVDCLDEQIFKVLNMAKVPWITVGVENVVPKVLRYFKRTDDIKNYLSKIDQAVRLLKHYKMGAAFSFVLGSPVETFDDTEKNLFFMEKLNSQDFLIYSSILRLVPGSFLWQQYQSGKEKIFLKGKTGASFPFDDGFEDIEWICPGNFSFQHRLYSNRRYLEIQKKIQARISQFNRIPN